MQFSFILNVNHWKELTQQFSSVKHAQTHFGVGVWGSSAVSKRDEEANLISLMYFIYIISPQPASMQCVQDPRSVKLMCVKAGCSFSISGVRANETAVNDGSLNTEAALPK